MSFEVLYHALVVSEDIPRLDGMKMRIRSAIEQKLMAHPELFGKPLRSTLKHYWKLRMGDYRIIYKIEQHTVRILAIQHRSAVYAKIFGRLK